MGRSGGAASIEVAGRAGVEDRGAALGFVCHSHNDRIYRKRYAVKPELIVDVSGGRFEIGLLCQAGRASARCHDRLGCLGIVH